MFQYPFPSWDRIVWCLVLAAAFALEFLGIVKPSEATLTRLICATLPPWVRSMILGWLVYHFLIANK
jgi:hypothetical protein